MTPTAFRALRVAHKPQGQPQDPDSGVTSLAPLGLIPRPGALEVLVHNLGVQCSCQRG